MKKRVLFVDDEPNIIQGLQRMLRCMRDEWDVTFADGGMTALEILKQKQFDVIVTDMRMPVIDGAELLNRVKLLYPNMIRIILSGHSDREMVMRAVPSTHQFLPKPCDSQTLIDTINRACQLRQTLNNDHIRQLVGGLTSLPSMPDVYNQVLQEFQNHEISLKRISDLIAQDVTMTAEILKLVNSAFFGLSRRISSLQQAVSLLGVDILKGLILYINFFTACKVDQRLDFSIQDLCQHSMFVSDFSAKIARQEKLDKKVTEDILIAGFLHDIGKIVLSQAPEEYLKVKQYSADKKCNTTEAEYQVLGTSHAEIGAYLLALWGNSESIIELVNSHHDEAAFLLHQVSPLGIIQFANRLANVTGDYETLIRQVSDMGDLAADTLEHWNSWRLLCQESTEGENHNE
jgi:putative nucleotidyltransferase with HDIG domain